MWQAGWQSCAALTLADAVMQTADALGLPTHDGPGVCVVVRASSSQRHQLAGTMLSLGAAAYPGLKVFVINTDPEPEPFNTFFRSARTAARGQTKGLGVEFYQLDLPFTQHDVAHLTKGVNDFGYMLTDIAAAQLLSPPYQSQCEYLMFTNGDNLYNRRWIEASMPGMKEGYDVITWPFVSHHRFRVDDEIQTDVVIQAEPPDGQTPDLGASLINADALRRVGSLDFTRSWKINATSPIVRPVVGARDDGASGGVGVVDKKYSQIKDTKGIEKVVFGEKRLFLLAFDDKVGTEANLEALRKKVPIGGDLPFRLGSGIDVHESFFPRNAMYNADMDMYLRLFHLPEARIKVLKRILFIHQ